MRVRVLVCSYVFRQVFVESVLNRFYQYFHPKRFVREGAQIIFDNVNVTHLDNNVYFFLWWRF